MWKTSCRLPKSLLINFLQVERFTERSDAQTYTMWCFREHTCIWPLTPACVSLSSCLLAYFFPRCTSAVLFHRCDISFHPKGEKVQVSCTAGKWLQVRVLWASLVLSNELCSRNPIRGHIKLVKCRAGQEAEDPVSVWIFCTVVYLQQWWVSEGRNSFLYLMTLSVTLKQPVQ